MRPEELAGIRTRDVHAWRNLDNAPHDVWRAALVDRRSLLAEVDRLTEERRLLALRLAESSDLVSQLLRQKEGSA